MQVPPSLPGKGCEPSFSFQFRMWSKSPMAAVLLAPTMRRLSRAVRPCQRGDLQGCSAELHDLATPATAVDRFHLGVKTATANFLSSRWKTRRRMKRGSVRRSIAVPALTLGSIPARPLGLARGYSRRADLVAFRTYVV